MIKELISAGVITEYLDFRSGIGRDWSGNGNDGVLTDTEIAYNGIKFPLTTSVVEVPYDASIDSTAGSFIVLADRFDHAPIGTQMYFQRRRGGMILEFGHSTSPVNVFFTLHNVADHEPADSERLRAVNYLDGSFANLWVDGDFVGTFTSTFTYTPGGNGFTIGNNIFGGVQFKDTLQAFLFANRALTAEEHAGVYEDLLTVDFGDVDLFQEGDIDLFQTADDGDIAIDNGVTRMTGRYGTAVYLSLWGGNEDDPGGSDTALRWWGDATYRSQTQYLLKTLPATSENLQILKRAIEKDLAWIEDDKNIDIRIPSLNRVDIHISITRAGKIETHVYGANWKATQ